MGECTFPPEPIHCDEHGRLPALCTHAAADLKRRLTAYMTDVERLAHKDIDSDERIADLESRLARLEEEKAQWIADRADLIRDDQERLQAIAAQYEERLKAQLEDAWRERDQAEAREAALREALNTIDQLRKRLPDPDFGEQQTTARAIGEVVHAVLSPDAGRAPIDGSGIAPAPPVSLRDGKTPDSKTVSYSALAAEVEKLREHAQDAHEDLGHPDGLMSTATWQYCEQHPCRKLRDALGK